MSINNVGIQRPHLLPTRRRRATGRVLVAALALLALVLSACGSDAVGGAAEAGSGDTVPQVPVPDSVPAGTTLRVGDQLDFLSTLLALSGQDQDFPYRVEYGSFLGGPAMLQAFNAGEIDTGFVADAPLIFAQAAGQDITGVAAWAPGQSALGLVTAPGVTDIDGWGDLEGKTVITQEGTVLQSTLLTGLASEGLSYADVTTQNLVATQIAQALPGSGADAAILTEPFTTTYLKDNPTAKLVARGEDITDRVNFLIASGSALKDEGRTAALADYIGRIVRGWQWVNANPEAWAQKIYVEKYGLPLDAATAQVKANGGVQVLELPGDLQEPQQALADLFHEAKVIPEQIDAATEFDPRFNTVVKEANSR